MITHDEAKEFVDGIYANADNEWNTKDMLLTYITQQEQRDKDVARYFQLDYREKLYGDLTNDEYDEYMQLQEKLTKGVAR